MDTGIKESYDAFCSKVNLSELQITELSYKKISDPDFAEDNSYFYDVKPQKTQYSLSSEDQSGFTVDHTTQFKIFSEGNDETPDIFQLTATFELVYECDMEISEDIFSKFKEKDVPLVCHPYLREIVSSSMTRAGLRPITIPLFRQT